MGFGRDRVNERDNGGVCEYERRCDRAYSCTRSSGDSKASKASTSKSFSTIFSICSGELVRFMELGDLALELDRDDLDFDLATEVLERDNVLVFISPSRRDTSSTGDGGLLISVLLSPSVTSV